MSYIKTYAYAMRKEDFDSLIETAEKEGYKEGKRLLIEGKPYIIERDGEEYAVGDSRDMDYKYNSLAWSDFANLARRSKHGVVLLSYVDCDDDGVDSTIWGEDYPDFDDNLYDLISYKIVWNLPERRANA